MVPVTPVVPATPSVTPFVPATPFVPGTPHVPATTTPCSVVEGMRDPLLTPSKMIITDDAESNKNIDRIRPNNPRGPLPVDKDTIKIRVWFSKAIPLHSLALIVAKNVKSFNAYYVLPGKVNPVQVNGVSTIS
jgi:hypothetical protein